MTDNTTGVVFCLIEGDSTPFKVTPNKGDILVLKELILKGIGSHRNMDPAVLVLWKVGPFNTQHKLADSPGSSMNQNL